MQCLGSCCIIEHVFVAPTSLREISDSQLADELLDLSEQIDRLRARQIEVAAQFDARMVYAADGAANAAVWLAPRARMSRAEAGQVVGLARKLERMPQTAEAVASGTLSTSQARVLSRVVNERTASVFAEHEDVLIEQAARLTVDQLRRVVKVWEAHADTDGADPAQRLHDRRKAYISTGFDGMGHLEADLDPEATAIVSTVLETIACSAPTARSSTWAGPAESPPPPSAEHCSSATAAACSRALIDRRAGARPITWSTGSTSGRPTLGTSRILSRDPPRGRGLTG